MKFIGLDLSLLIFLSTILFIVFSNAQSVPCIAYKYDPNNPEVTHGSFDFTSYVPKAFFMEVEYESFWGQENRQSWTYALQFCQRFDAFVSKTRQHRQNDPCSMRKKERMNERMIGIDWIALIQLFFQV